VTRDKKHIVAVVLGGTSNGQRDALMRKLIEDQIPHASLQRTAPVITEAAHEEGPPANPILTAAGAPAVATFVPASIPSSAAPVASAPAPAAAPTAPPAAAAPPVPPAAIVTAAPAGAPPASANPVVPSSNFLPASATFRGSVGPDAAPAKTSPALSQTGSKPRPRSAKAQPTAPPLPQDPFAKPVATAARVAHHSAAPVQGKAASTTAAAQPRRATTKPTVP
jgi:D-alanyl-D-alanine carboxypeptidase